MSRHALKIYKNKIMISDQWIYSNQNNIVFKNRVQENVSVKRKKKQNE